MTARVWIPIDVNVASVAALMSPGLDQIEKGLAGAVENAWLAAQRKLQGDGIDHRPRPGIASFEWAGTGWRGIPASERHRIERRLRGAIERATTTVVRAPRRSTADQPGVKLDRRIAFQATPRRFFQLLGAGLLAREQPVARYYDVLDQSHDGLAFHVTTSGMMFLDELYPLLERALGARTPSGMRFFYLLVWQPLWLRKVIALDPKRLHDPLDGAPLSALWATRGLIYVPQGSHLVVACLLLPQIARRTATLPEEVERVTVKLRELDPIVERQPFLVATGATWDSYRREWGDDDIAVTLYPFSLKKPTHARTLQALYAAEADAEARERLQLGGLILLTRKAVDDFPSLPLHEFSSTPTLALPDSSVNGEWQAGWHGVYLSAWLPDDDFKVGAARYRPEARVLAAKIVALLNDDDPSHRVFAVIASAYGQSDRDLAQSTTAFGFLLEQLDEMAPKGKWLAALYEAAEAYYDLFQLVVRLASGTPYESHPVVLRATNRIADQRDKARSHVYLEHEGVLVDRHWILRKGNVLRDGNSMYSVLEKRTRIKPSAQPKLRGWILDAASTVVKSAVAARRELSKEEFSRAVIEEVQKQITQDDVEEVEVERSLRLIDVIEKPDRGVLRHFVLFNWVERVEGESGWADVKDEQGRVDVVTREDDKFEELLFMWSFARSSVAVIAFSKGITYIGAFVIAWEVGVFELVPHALGFMAFNVLLYLGRAAFFGGDFSIDGLALEGVKGFAMALGFQLFMPLGRFAGAWVAERIGIESIAQRVAGYLLERAVAGGLAGAATGALTTFATDLALIAMGAKSGFSGWRTYLDAMEDGAKIGVFFEFGGDALRVLGKLDGFQAVAAAIGKAGWSPRQWWKMIDEAHAGLHKWLFEVAVDVQTLSMRELLDELLVEAGRLKGLVFEEAKQGLLRRILTRSGMKLSAVGEEGLQRLVEALEAKVAEPVLLRLARDPAAAGRFFEALAVLDQDFLDILAKQDQLAALASTTRLLELISRRTRLATSVLDAFGLNVLACERFLVELENLPEAAHEPGLTLLTGAGPRPSPALLLRALRHPGLLHPGLAGMLVHMEAAGLRAGAVLDELLTALDRAHWTFGAEAMTGLIVLARTIGRAEMNEIVAAVSSGSRTRAFLEATPKVGADLLGRAFRGAPADLERFLSRLDRLPSPEASRTLAAVTRLGVDDTASAVTASGKTIEALLDLVGQKAEAAEALAKYSKQVVDKKFTALTKQDFANSLTRQKQIYSDALRFQARQQALADEVMARVGRQRGTAKSILKRDDLAEFVDGVLGKMARNKYSMVAEMNDMVRGRFDMADEEAVLSVTEALQTQKAFKLHPDAKGRPYEAPRLSASGKVRYPRYHFVLEDESGMTHEWQVGTKAATTLYEKRGIKIPSELTDAATKLGRKFNADLHDIEYDLFQGINKQYPQIAARNGLPAFIEEVVDASDRAAAGDAFVELNETIVRLQDRASTLLKQLVDNQGAEWVAQFFH